MARVLLAAHSTVGHTNALRAIGRRLLGSGHAVAFAMPVARAPGWRIVPEAMRTAASLPAATLAAGRPMLVIPFGGDQVENARRVERLGVGIALPSAALEPGAVRAAAARLLGEPGFARSAAALALGLRRRGELVREFGGEGAGLRAAPHRAPSHGTSAIRPQGTTRVAPRRVDVSPP